MTPEQREVARIRSKNWYANNKERAGKRSQQYAKEHPEITKKAYTQWRAKNAEKLRDYNKKRRIEKPHLQRKYSLVKYGLTLEGWAEMFAKQGSCCAGCGSDKPGGVKGWCTDHCHTTGKVRGILCRGCNVALGNVNDNPIVLRKLADYLESSE